MQHETYLSLHTDEFVLGESEMKDVLYFYRNDEKEFKDTQENTIEVVKALMEQYLSYKSEEEGYLTANINRPVYFEFATDNKTVRITLGVPYDVKNNDLN